MFIPGSLFRIYYNLFRSSSTRKSVNPPYWANILILNKIKKGLFGNVLANLFNQASPCRSVSLLVYVFIVLHIAFSDQDKKLTKI